MTAGCELCVLRRRTPWHYEDGVIVICDCLTCGVPMVVFRRHGELDESERHHARQTIMRLYGERLANIRMKARLVKNHEHWHLYLK